MKSKFFRGRVLITKVLAFTLACVPSCYFVYADTTPVVEPASSNGKSVLFDNAHAQTAGAADWVIDGAFSDFAEGLANEGYYVKELRKDSGITYSDLSEYDVFVIPEANVPFKVSEQEALVQYVDNGGSILFVADHYNSDRNKNRWDSSEVFNGYRRGAYEDPTKGMNAGEKASEAMKEVESSDWLANNFGVRFRYNALGDLSANVIVSPEESFNITNNINSVAIHAGSTVAIVDPEVAKGIIYAPNGLTSANKWSSAVDQGVYNAGGIAEGPYVAIAKKGQGKAAFIGDTSLVEDATPKYVREENGKTKKTYDGYKEEDDGVLLMQLVNWLSEDEAYTSFAEAGIPLDTPTTLYDFETPELSTEPQAEPWAKPATSYKWYDQTTFAKGAYKYVAESSTNPTDPTPTPSPTPDPTPSPTPDPTPNPTEEVAAYVLNKPTEVIANQELPLTIEFNNLAPNTTLTNVSVGAYLDGGTQVGLFKELNAAWPTSYGYSKAFSVTTDENGKASKTLVFKIKDNVKGNINLRIKKGSSKVLTEKLYVSEESNANLPAAGTPVYSIIKAEAIHNNEEMALTLRVRNMNPGATLSKVRVGSYLDGGTQIGQFMKADGTWPTDFGYSEYINLTADENGVATQTFLIKIKKGTTGSANLRIKLGSKNVLTEKIMID